MSRAPSLRPYESVARDRGLMDEIRERLARGPVPAMRNLDLRVADVRGIVEGMAARGARPGPGDHTAEAIVLTLGRPTCLIRAGSVVLPELPSWRQRIEADRTSIERVIPSVGRVEVTGLTGYDWLGTAWMVDETTAVTNRHVAREFARRDASGEPVFARAFDGTSMTARVDFLEEYQQAGGDRQVRVERILYVAPEGDAVPDIALLRLERSSLLPRPLELAEADARSEQQVGTVGYPAFDSRSDADAVHNYFGDIFDVKRFAPGQVMSGDTGSHWFTHDCTTLGGASGSPVFERSTGRVLGLHFAGQFRAGNFAVKVSEIKRVLRDLGGGAVPVLPLDAAGSEATDTHSPAHFAGRRGFDEGFLGDDARLPLPSLGSHAADAVDVTGGGNVLRYQHFSVVLSRSRRLPRFTAVNIDGLNARRIPRGNDRWFYDGRAPRAAQAGNEVYQGNDLDRGHMVRREDPNWGATREEAVLANDDTFHFTNSCPQHANLNQREWLGLEDYILGTAKARDLRVSVFTGPVLRGDDPVYRGVRIPREYWKVAVVVDEDTDRMVATGYVLSQASLLDDVLAEEFVFGAYKTYQVPVSTIEQRTGLSFGDVARNDPLERRNRAEGRAAAGAIELRTTGDIILR